MMSLDTFPVPVPNIVVWNKSSNNNWILLVNGAWAWLYNSMVHGDTVAAVCVEL